MDDFCAWILRVIEHGTSRYKPLKKTQSDPAIMLPMINALNTKRKATGVAGSSELAGGRTSCYNGVQFGDLDKRLQVSPWSLKSMSIHQPPGMTT